MDFSWHSLWGPVCPGISEQECHEEKERQRLSQGVIMGINMEGPLSTGTPLYFYLCFWCFLASLVYLMDTKFASKGLSDSHSHDMQDGVVTPSTGSVGVCLLLAIISLLSIPCDADALCFKKRI